MARQISGQPKGLLSELNSITGPEYFARIQRDEVQRLADFGSLIRDGSTESAKTVLQDAISVLWRVGADRKQRLEGERIL